MSAQIEKFAEQAKWRELNARLVRLDGLGHEVETLLARSESSKDIGRIIDLMNKLSVQLRDVSLLLLDASANRDLETAFQALTKSVAEIDRALLQQRSSR